MVALTDETIGFLSPSADMRELSALMAKMHDEMIATMALPSELLNPSNIAPIKWKRPMPDAYDDENPNTRNAAEFLEALTEKVKTGELFVGDLVVDRSNNDRARMNISIKIVRGKNAQDEVDLPATGQYAPKLPEKKPQLTQQQMRQQEARRAMQWQRPANSLDSYRQPEPTFGYDDLPSPADGYMEEEAQELTGAPARQKPPDGTRDLDLDI